MTDNFIKIGDIVYVPKHKVIGTVINKRYNVERSDYFTINIDVDIKKSKLINNTQIPFTLDVEHYLVKPLNLQSLYKLNTISNDIIPNTLKLKDIKRNRKVKFVDNHMLENMIMDPISKRIYNKCDINDILFGTLKLTGKYNTEYCDRLLAETIKTIYKTESSMGYIYADCLQIDRKIDWNKFISKIKKLLRL